jgi:hypothetical protein
VNSTSVNWSQWLGLAILVAFFLLTILFALSDHWQRWLAKIFGDYQGSGRVASDLKINLRTIPVFTNMRNAIEGVVEGGKQVLLSLGSGSLNGLQGGSAFTGLQILDEVGAITSGSDDSVVATSGDGAVALLSQDALERTFPSTPDARLAAFQTAQVSGLTPISYVVGALPLLADGSVTRNLAAGHYDGEILLLVEAGERNSISTLGGSDSLLAQSVLFPATPDVLIGEEFYAAGAYLGKQRWRVASLFAQDVIRWTLVGAILLGILLKLADIL